MRLNFNNKWYRKNFKNRNQADIILKNDIRYKVDTMKERLQYKIALQFHTGIVRKAFSGL